MTRRANSGYSLLALHGLQQKRAAGFARR